MRYTLEQLKGISDAELTRMWRKGEFPFDKATCGSCLICHQGERFNCGHSAHTGLMAQINAMPFLHTWAEEFRPYLEELYALRLFWDHLYPQEKEVSDAANNPLVQSL